MTKAVLVVVWFVFSVPSLAQTEQDGSDRCFELAEYINAREECQYRACLGDKKKRPSTYFLKNACLNVKPIELDVPWR